MADPVPASAAAGDEGQPIEGLDLGTLEAYVGVMGASVIKPAVSTPTAAAAGMAAAVMAAAAGGSPALARMETGLSEMSNPLEPSGRSASRGYESGSDQGGPAVGRDETAAQAAARAAFRRDTAGRWCREDLVIQKETWTAWLGSLAGLACWNACGQSAVPQASVRALGHFNLAVPACLRMPFIQLWLIFSCPHFCPPSFVSPGWAACADDEDDFFSSDEESAPTETDSRCVSVSPKCHLTVSGACCFPVYMKP